MEIKAATLKAMQEIQAPIIAIACVLAAIFIPAAFGEGITSELYRQFALTIVVSMFLSTIGALFYSCALRFAFQAARKKFSAVFDRFKGGFKNLLEVFILLIVPILFSLIVRQQS